MNSPGMKTSEWKLTVGGIIVSVLLLIIKAVLPDFPASGLEQPISDIVNLIIAYVGSRSVVKVAEMYRDSKTEPVKIARGAK